jgi:hypothetical protein
MQRISSMNRCIGQLGGICCLVLCSPEIGHSQCDDLLVDHFLGTASICAGTCSDITATFTGTPPFNLTYEISGIEQNNLTFQNNIHIFQVCIPADAQPGNLSLQALIS